MPAEPLLLETSAGLRALTGTTGGAANVAIASSALPSGAATLAEQEAQSLYLDAINDKLPALSGGAVPVTGTVTGPAAAALATEATLSTLLANLQNLITATAPAEAAEIVDISGGDFVPSIGGVQGLFVGTGGAVKVDMSGGGTVTFGNVPSGTTLKINPTKVYQVGTLASNMAILGNG